MTWGLYNCKVAFLISAQLFLWLSLKILQQLNKTPFIGLYEDTFQYVIDTKYMSQATYLKSFF
jgi:hypothetical protein